MPQISHINNSATRTEALNSVVSAFFSYDTKEKKFNWSSEIFSILGFDKKESDLISSFSKNIVKEDQARWTDFFEQIKKGKAPAGIELKAQSKDLIKTLWLGAAALNNDNHEVILIAGSLQDLTQRKQLETELIHNDEKLSKFSQLATECCIILENGIVIDHNLAFEKISGYEGNELHGKSAQELLTNESFKTMVENLKKNYTFPYELTMVRKDNALVPIEVQGYFFEYMGRTLRFTSIRDITKLKEKEKQGSNLSVLIELSKSKNVVSGNYKEALADILEKIADTLKVKRVSLWDCGPGKPNIRRIGMFADDKYLADRAIIHHSAFMGCIQLLMSDGAVMINDTTVDPATKNIPVSAFWPANVKSLLQLPVIVDGEVSGLLSIEQTDEVINWSTQDMLFAKSVVDIIIITYKSFQRLRAEKKVKLKNQQLHKQKLIIEEKNKDIVDSINYSKRIQGSFLKKSWRLQESYPESFIFYRPKDIIGGDFYWFNFVDGKLILAVADCTGHGVPGALMSVLGVTQIAKVVEMHGASSPSVLLKEFDKAIKEALHDNSEKEQSIRDGMEIALCVYDPAKKQLTYSAAMRPMMKQSANGIEIIKGDKITIGDPDKENPEFTDHVFSVSNGERFFFFSDGLQDQFGGEKKKKFSMKRIEDFVARHQDKNMTVTGVNIEKEFLDWKGELEQTDDVLIAGIQFI